jgi:hypothetical protein
MNKHQFEELLKQSDYLNSVLESHRIATAETIALLIKHLAADDANRAQVITSLLSDLNQPTNRPSIDGSRHRLAVAIRRAVAQ